MSILEKFVTSITEGSYREFKKIESKYVYISTNQYIPNVVVSFQPMTHEQFDYEYLDKDGILIDKDSVIYAYENK